MKKSLITLALAAVLALPASSGFAHCQIPCGIYDDAMRFDMIEEHLTTIEKSMKQIEELSSAGEKNPNQIVRWVMNKEDHASQLSEIVTYYFMAQRVKPAGADDAEYVEKITLLHAMQVTAMKAKQTTDTEHVDKLRELTGKFRKAYFGEAEEAHAHDHSGEDHPHEETKPAKSAMDEMKSEMEKMREKMEQGMKATTRPNE